MLEASELGQADTSAGCSLPYKLGPAHGADCQLRVGVALPAPPAVDFPRYVLPLPAFHGRGRQRDRENFGYVADGEVVRHQVDTALPGLEVQPQRQEGHVCLREGPDVSSLDRRASYLVKGFGGRLGHLDPCVDQGRTYVVVLDFLEDEVGREVATAAPVGNP